MKKGYTYYMICGHSNGHKSCKDGNEPSLLKCANCLQFAQKEKYTGGKGVEPPAVVAYSSHWEDR
jgi:hypothetical protein